jgi:hypothetical protein
VNPSAARKPDAGLGDLVGVLSDRPVLVAATGLHVLGASFASFAAVLVVRQRRAA